MPRPIAPPNPVMVRLRELERQEAKAARHAKKEPEAVEAEPVKKQPMRKWKTK